VAQEFTRQFPHKGKAEVTLLVDEKIDDSELRKFASVRQLVPAKHNIIETISNYAGSADKEDALIFYFFGHGTVEDHNRQVLHATDSDGHSDYHVPLEEIRLRIEAGLSRRRLVILDTCRSHSSQGFSGTDEFFSKNATTRTQWAPQTAVVYSSSDGQESFPHLDSGIGWFTKYLLEGLSWCSADGFSNSDSSRQPDGKLELMELLSYVTPKLMAETMSRYKQLYPPGRYSGQHPDLVQQKNPDAPDMVLSYCSSTPPSPPVQSPPIPIYRKWWPWTLAGVAATALGIGLGIGLTRPVAVEEIQWQPVP
jgi:uncharacterized caspase-like protein